MKLNQVLALSFVSLLLAGRASADYCFNKDLVNLGPTAYDIAVEITGNQPLSFHYDGGTGAIFSSLTVTPAGPNEILHWQNLNGNNTPIPPGNPNGPAQVHIGWCTVSPNNSVQMYWTDLLGAQIPNSIVDQISGHASANSTPGVQWDNASNHPITVSKIYYAIVTTPYPLKDLNHNNRALAGQLKALPGGTSLVIQPGASAQLPVPGAPWGATVVLVYEVHGSRSQAAVTDFGQFQLIKTTTP